MYAIHSTPILPDTAFIRNYAPSTSGVYSSIKKNWNSMHVTVSKESNIVQLMEFDSIPEEVMMAAQQLSVEETWNSPENDVWDEMHRRLNG